MQQVNAEPYISVTQKYIEVNSDQLSHAVELLCKARMDFGQSAATDDFEPNLTEILRRHKQLLFCAAKDAIEPK